MNIEVLIPVSLFFTMVALYLGALSVDVVGGTGGRQLLALLVMFALYVAVWFGLHLALRSFGGVFGRVLIPTVIALLAFPLLARAAFMVLGMRIERGHAAH